MFKCDATVIFNNMYLYYISHATTDWICLQNINGTLEFCHIFHDCNLQIKHFNTFSKFKQKDQFLHQKFYRHNWALIEFLLHILPDYLKGISNFTYSKCLKLKHFICICFKARDLLKQYQKNIF